MPHVRALGALALAFPPRVRSDRERGVSMSAQGYGETQTEGEGAGLVVRGPDGALYFIRDNVLEQAKLPSDLAEQAEQLLKERHDHTDRFKVSESKGLDVLARVEGQVGFRQNLAAASTVMCPSFLFSRTGDPARPGEV
jgi:hypothetical protein